VDVGDQIETVFASEDMQEEISDDGALLSRRWQLHPAHSMQCERVFADGEWKTQMQRLICTQGILYSKDLDEITMSFLNSLDRANNLREAILSVANSDRADGDSVFQKCMALTRDLIRDGLITPTH
jgi:hypothetical protein